MTTPEFNNLAEGVFNGRLAEVDLVTKTILILNCKILAKELLQINPNICLLKMN